MSLEGFQWVTNARNGGGTYSGVPYYNYPPSILLHMTVGTGISAGYISGHSSPPHVWANPYTRERFQTIELDRSALALWQPDYGTHWLNKKTFCLQTELVGVPVVNQATYTDAHLRWIAEYVVVPQERWLRARGLTANIGNYRYHTDSSGSASADWPGRMTEQEWADFNGLCAHIDAWANDHWDCSVERLDLISRYALEILGGGAPTPTPTPTPDIWSDMAYQALDPAGTIWMVNPPFKCAMSDDKLRQDYISRGWLDPKIERVHEWTLNQLVTIEPRSFLAALGLQSDDAAADDAGVADDGSELSGPARPKGADDAGDPYNDPKAAEARRSDDTPPPDP
jgi:hypothetical protein